MARTETLVRIFEYALNQEETGKSFFETSLARLGVGAAVTAFSRLVEEEKRHILFIQSILARLRGEGGIDLAGIRDVVLEPKDYFDARARKEFLDRCVYESMVPDVTVFSTAFLIERDLREFYAGMAKKAEGEARQALEMLAAWEEGHERFFREFRDKLTETYAAMPWGG